MLRKYDNGVLDIVERKRCPPGYNPNEIVSVQWDNQKHIAAYFD
jgi:hypothetical protein